MKFTLNGLEVTCTPAEFNELRGLGTITAEHTSVSTQSVADACKAAGIPLEKTECNIDWSKVAIWPPRNEGPGTKFPPVPKGSDGEGVTLDKIAPEPDACKAADKELYYVDGPGFHWDTNKNRLCLRGKKELKDTLPESPDVDDAIALAKDYRPGCRYTYAIAMRRKDNIYTNYLRSTLGNSYTADIADAVQFAAPEDAFDFIDARPDLDLCVLRVKVAP